jgi:serine/threonine protein kinase
MKTLRSLQELETEIKIIKTLTAKGSKNIPEYRYRDSVNGRPCIIMTRLGKDLQQISDDHGTFDKPTTVFVGVQLITLVQEIHQVGFVHNDLKPSCIIAGNFIEPYEHDVIKLIGFGKSTCYTTKPSSMQEPANDSEHVDISQGVGPQNPSRRDDLVSVLYLLVYF